MYFEEHNVIHDFVHVVFNTVVALLIFIILCRSITCIMIISAPGSGHGRQRESVDGLPRDASG